MAVAFRIARGRIGRTKGIACSGPALGVFTDSFVKWFAEKKIHTSLRKMANAAQSDALRAAFRKHEAETQGQIALGTVFGLIDRIASRFAAFAHGRLCDM